MNREADHTIKGFVYQFNKTLEELLNSDEGANVKVEGIVEDIDVISSDTIKAIQCKYRETKKDFTISDISKPVLQMLAHFSENKDKNIQYILYAHFPNEPEGEKAITKVDIENIIGTQNQKYIANYISKIKPANNSDIEMLISKERKSRDDLKKIKDYYSTKTDLTLSIDIEEFLKPEKFKFIIGKSFQNLVEEVKKLLKENSSFTQQDIEDLFYPNAIQLIADKSIEQDECNRNVEKKDFVFHLEKTKKVAISRWTKELLSFQKLLKKRREQLLHNLKENHRLRYFIFDANSIDNFDNQIVNFIVDYLNKYHYKIKLHSKTPIFCFQTNDTELLCDIESRLYEKDIEITTGFKGKKFYEKEFLKEPQRIIHKSWFAFRLRLCVISDEIIDIIRNNKCDDLFLIGKTKNKKIDDILDINIERIDMSNFDELKYLLNLKSDFE